MKNGCISSYSFNQHLWMHFIVNGGNLCFFYLSCTTMLCFFFPQTCACNPSHAKKSTCRLLWLDGSLKPVLSMKCKQYIRFSVDEARLLILFSLWKSRTGPPPRPWVPPRCQTCSQQTWTGLAWTYYGPLDFVSVNLTPLMGKRNDRLSSSDFTIF